MEPRQEIWDKAEESHGFFLVLYFVSLTESEVSDVAAKIPAFLPLILKHFLSLSLVVCKMCIPALPLALYVARGRP